MNLGQVDVSSERRTPRVRLRSRGRHGRSIAVPQPQPTAGRSSDRPRTADSGCDEVRREILKFDDRISHLVEPAAADREARVFRFGHALQVFGQRQRAVEIHDVGARHHHIVDGHLGDCNRAFHHSQGIGADQAISLHVAQQLDQVFLAGGLAGQRGADAFQP